MTLLKDWRTSIRTFCLDRVFLAVALIKLVSGAFLYSHYLRDLFIPFVSFFVDSGFSDPWTEFMHRGIFDAFSAFVHHAGGARHPAVVGSWLFHGSANIPWALQLFLTRLPIFMADACIYVVLCRWFETKWRYVLFLYWCSPFYFSSTIGLASWMLFRRHSLFLASGTPCGCLR